MQADITPHLPTEIDLNDVEFILIGEAPGADEEKQGKPFVGASGKLLRKTCQKLGLTDGYIYITNVFWKRPPDNAVQFFFGKEKDGGELCHDLPAFKGMRLKEEWRSEMSRLDDEIFNLNPKVVVTVGATPTWALTGKDKITQVRGGPTTISGCMTKSKGMTVIPTLHPAYVLRNRNAQSQLEEDLTLAQSYTTIKNANDELFSFKG